MSKKNSNKIFDIGILHDAAPPVVPDDSPPPVVPGDDEVSPVVPDGVPPVVPDEVPPVVPGDNAKPPVVPGDDDSSGAHSDSEVNDLQEEVLPSQKRLDGGVRSAPTQLTPEMRQWLTDNRDAYEFYMMHQAFHDPLWRLKMIGTPVIPDDFSREEFALVMGALIGATNIVGTMGHDVPTPPSREFLRTYVEVVARNLGSDDDDVGMALQLISGMQDPKYSEMHHVVPAYFEAWYGSVRGKRAAAELMRTPVPDARVIAEGLLDALAGASQLDASLDACRFDFENEPKRPEPTLELGEHAICTPGNISNIQALPKAAKTSVVGAILAATMQEPWKPADTLGFTAECPAGRAVLHFDTEQSRYDHDQVMRRAHARVNRNEAVPWLYSYWITSRDPASCWDFLLRAVTRAVEDHGGIMLVIIDGIADFCRDPNDSDECFDLVRKLHRLAVDHECVVLTVLHENPGSNFGKTRGHLGSQLERKAETSLRLAKDQETGIVSLWAERARSCFIPKQAARKFRWCESANMLITLGDSDDASGDTKPDKREKYADEVAKIFSGQGSLRNCELKARFAEVTRMTQSTAGTRIREYLALGLIEKTDGGKRYQPVSPSPSK